MNYLINFKKILFCRERIILKNNVYKFSSKKICIIELFLAIQFIHMFELSCSFGIVPVLSPTYMSPTPSQIVCLNDPEFKEALNQIYR